MFVVRNKDIVFSDGGEILGIYDGAVQYGEKMIKVRFGKKWVFMDNDGRLLVNMAHYVIGFPKNGLLLVKCYGGMGVINKKDEIIIYPEYDDITILDKAIVVKKNGKYGMFNLEGNKLTEVIYDEIYLMGGDKEW